MLKQKNKPLIANQKGQAMLESMLIAFILITVSILFVKQIRDRQILETLVEDNWKKIAGMIENGVWKESVAGRMDHPGQLQRHSSPISTPLAAGGPVGP